MVPSLTKWEPPGTSNRQDGWVGASWGGCGWGGGPPRLPSRAPSPGLSCRSSPAGLGSQGWVGTWQAHLGAGHLDNKGFPVVGWLLAADGRWLGQGLGPGGALAQRAQSMPSPLQVQNGGGGHCSAPSLGTCIVGGLRLRPRAPRSTVGTCRCHAQCAPPGGQVWGLLGLTGALHPAPPRGLCKTWIFKINYLKGRDPERKGDRERYLPSLVFSPDGSTAGVKSFLQVCPCMRGLKDLDSTAFPGR